MATALEARRSRSSGRVDIERAHDSLERGFTADVERQIRVVGPRGGEGDAVAVLPVHRAVEDTRLLGGHLAHRGQVRLVGIRERRKKSIRGVREQARAAGVE